MTVGKETVVLFYFWPRWQHKGSYFPKQGSNPSSLQRMLRVLTTGLPGKTLSSLLRCQSHTVASWLVTLANFTGTTDSVKLCKTRILAYSFVKW